MKVGRNNPCPCGSGQKFKHCCLGKGALQEPERQSDTARVLISPNDIGDYGMPEVDGNFFRRNPVEEFSAQRLFYSSLLMPELESLANRLVKRVISRGSAEAARIRRTDDPADLVAILKQEPDILNHRLLVDKILQRREAAVPLLIEGLCHDHNFCFAELTSRILYQSKMNCAPALLRLVHTTPFDAYTLSLISLVLGMIGAPEARQPLWDRFHFFKERFPFENFSQGPLIGLHELREKMRLSCQEK